MKHLLFAILTMVLVPHLYANYYVDAATGSDDNDGTEANPLKTLQKGIDVAGADSVAANKVVWVKPGVYDVESSLINNKSVKVWATDFEHPENTIIKGAGEDKESYIKFGSQSLLCGFTIQDFHCTTNIVIGNEKNSFNLSNCVIRSCSAVSNFLFFARSYWNVEIRDCRVSEKAKLFELGGGAEFTGCFISNCIVTTSIAMTNVDFNYGASLIYANGNKVLRSRFIGNRVICDVPNQNVYALSVLNPYVVDCVFIDNIATNTAPGAESKVSFAGGAASYSNSVFVATTMPLTSGWVGNRHYNVVVSNCVGRFVTKGYSPTTFYNSLFVNNTNTIDSAGGSDSMFMGRFFNCTFVGNADVRSPTMGIFHSQVPYFANCILHGNAPYDIGNMSFNAVASNVLYGTVGPSLDKNKLINCIQADDPKFNLGANPNLPYYALKKGSPAINAGNIANNPTLDAKDNPIYIEFDLFGNPRVNTEDGQGVIDLGCYEYYPFNLGFKIILR